MIRHILNVFHKERLDTFRDRRTVFAAMAYAFLGPGLLLVVLNFLATQANDESATRLAIEGRDFAPNLVAFLEGEGVDIVDVAKGDTPWEKIGDATVLMIIDENFTTDLSQGRQAKLEIFADQTNSDFASRASKLRLLTSKFEGQITDVRLLSLGIPPALTKPMKVETRDLSAAGAKAKTISFMLIYFLVLAPFFSSLSVSIDTTAGERERKSLQSLLAQPVAAESLIIGKWLICTLFGITGTIIAVVGGLYALSFTSMEVLGIRLHLGLDAQLSVLASLIPLAILVSAVQILVSLSAKTYKEANTYLQLLSFTPVLIGLSLSLTNREVEGVVGYMPVLSHLQNTQAALLEGALDLNIALTSGAISIGLAVLCLVLAARRLKSEAILSAA